MTEKYFKYQASALLTTIQWLMMELQYGVIIQ